MEDVQPEQQTRVVIVNGQTIILQGDTGENLDIKINSDLLQEALHEADGNYSLDNAPSHDNNQDEQTNLPLLGSGCVAIYEGEGGETQTIQLTAELAQALGIRFTIDTEKNELSETQLDDGGNNIQFKEDTSQIIYSEDAGQNESEVMFETQVSEHNAIQESMEMEEGNGQFIETPQESLDALLGDGTTNSNQQITLVPQFINGQMRYLVEVQGSSQDTSEQFTDLDVPSPVKDISYSPELQQQRITFHNITSVATTTSPSGFTPITTPLPTTIQTINNYQCSRTTPSHASLLLNKVAKPKPVSSAQSYVSNVSTAASVTNTNTVQMSLPVRMIKKPSISLLQQTPTATRLVSKPILSKSPVVNNKPKIVPIPFFAKVPENVNATGLTLVSSAPKTLGTTTITPKHSSIVTTTGSKVIRVLGEKGLKAYQTIGVPVSRPTMPLKRVMTSDGKLLSTTIANVDPQKTSPGHCQTLLTKKIPVAKFNKSKPLGSSENPIQLVQHGQTFHSSVDGSLARTPMFMSYPNNPHCLSWEPKAPSVQTLNQDQLKQIATVLQEKIYDKPSRHNTIYNAETNTRIIYRVVYPEDLEQKVTDPRTNLAMPAARGRGKRGRPPKSARIGLGRGGTPPDASSGGGGSSVSLDGEEEDRLEDSSKGERKKVVARTRSGRVSRPPRHMVKDYKRLHRLDFEEPDLDDSDGGYSDYTPADQDNDTREPGGEESKLLPGLISTRRRKISSHFRCPTCQKIYLGHARMSRHFLAFPDHGSIEQLTSDMKADEDVAEIKKTPPTTPGRGRGKRRGPWAYLTPEARSERRKLKLREVLNPCEADELSEVAGPAVAGVLSLWDLLLLRVDAVRTQESYVATLCDELGALLEKVRSVAGEMLKPVSTDCPLAGIIELQDEAVCNALGVACGRYSVDDSPLRPTAKETISEPGSKRFKSGADPDVLSALTLVARKSDVDPQRGGEKPAVDRAMLLPADDLRIVDDIVNERLENLTGGYVLGAGDPFRPGIKTEGGFDPATDYEGEGDGGDGFELGGSGGEGGTGQAGDGFDPDEEIRFRNVPDGSFDPEMALAAMGEGREEVGGGKAPSASDSQTTRTFPGLGLVDVGLDESGPELDFEALSEEFNRNTSHSS